MLALPVILLLALIVLPYGWTQWVLRRHHRHREDFPGTGGELAEHLLQRFGVEGVRVEAGKSDHYDPADKAVRLTADKLAGKTLTAVAVAAHEVGHALQHHQGYRPLRWRTRLVSWVGPVERLGAALMIGAPLLAGLTRSPHVGALMVLGGLLSFGSAVLVHLLTLPVEWDASFRRALPVLAEGYVAPDDVRAARRILTAAALTYVSGSLVSILNFWRWWAILRR